ncbi:hypothetical protein MLD38_033266 [Melastoma candidum]|nr:hypothetical protein MLD38_033266 [Melastoma candidum]
MEENQLFDIIDPQVMKQGGQEEIVRVASLAKRCLHLRGRNRPSMKDVSTELDDIRRTNFPSGALQSQRGASEAHGYYHGDHDVIMLTDGDGDPLLLSQSW